jgi:hypothetical protein
MTATRVFMHNFTLFFALWVTLPAAEPPIRPIVAPFAMPQLQRPVFPDRTVSILDHGAVPGGATLNVDALQKAIDACVAAGGGRVRVPAGKWLTTPIVLKSRVHLHLEAGAEVIFTDEKKYYFSSTPRERISQD